MIQRDWIITDYCKNNIKQIGFVFNEKMNYWTYTFPVRFWKRKPTLFCHVCISREKDHVWVNVYDCMDYVYSAFYTQEYGRYGDFVEVAEKKILYKLKSLGIIERKPKNKEKKKYGSSKKLRKNNKNKISRRGT